jgi:hypothetical protein
MLSGDRVEPIQGPVELVQLGPGEFGPRGVVVGAVTEQEIAGGPEAGRFAAAVCHGSHRARRVWVATIGYRVRDNWLPAAQRIAGNSLLSVIAQISYIAGPALAGLVTAAFGPATVIAVDATSWAVLAASYARLTRLTRPPPLTPVTAVTPAPVTPAAPATPVAPVDPKITSVAPGPGNSAASPAPEPTSAWGVLRAQPVLLGLLALSAWP